VESSLRTALEYVPLTVAENLKAFWNREGGEVRGALPPATGLAGLAFPRALADAASAFGRWAPAGGSSERLGEGRCSESHW
jgi:hypothetical protein